MAGKNPGVWIGGAIALAVVIVAVSVPNNPQGPPVAKETSESTTQPALPSSIPATTATSDPGVQPPPSQPPKPAAPSPSPAPATANLPPRPVTPAVAPNAPLVVPPGAREEQPAPRVVPRTVAKQAVDNVHFALRDYRSALGENPEGSNEEITKALMGDNLKQVRVNMPEGSQVSKSGELCDPWGTPYFFHQLSKQKMEIRSAGPDLKMWTGDDIQM